MLIEVIGKGKKHRHTLHSKELLEELRSYYREYRPKTYLFSSAFKKQKDQPLSKSYLRLAFQYIQRFKITHIKTLSAPATNHLAFIRCARPSFL